MGCGDEKLSKYLTQTFMAHCSAMICHQVTLSGDAEWPKVADAVIEASIGFIGVSSGQECLESPVVGMLPQSLNELKEGRRLRVGELEGQLGSGKARPTPHEACRREEGE